MAEKKEGREQEREREQKSRENVREGEKVRSGGETVQGEHEMRRPGTEKSGERGSGNLPGAGSIERGQDLPKDKRTIGKAVATEDEEE
ncbi:MAG TPA: hypothetical protein VI997_12730 [Candidatus Thermoplasmatota archaeon]|nr:hypothetical protein [Candidatus Thermoplasmatota archaeon]